MATNDVKTSFTPQYHDDVIKWNDFSSLLAFCERTRSFNVFFDLRLNQQLSKQLDAGDLRCHRVHYDVIIMIDQFAYKRYVFICFSSHEVHSESARKVDSS